MYKKVKALIVGQPDNTIKRISDNAFIPFDPANTDYQEYLKWVAEGNEPLPAIEPQQPEVTPTPEPEVTPAPEQETPAP